MTNPFEDPDGTYLVLVNEEGQHSLWPAFVEVPSGWTIAHDRDTRQGCLDYVEAHWTDMRPRSLVEAMERNTVPAGVPTAPTAPTAPSAPTGADAR